MVGDDLGSRGGAGPVETRFCCTEAARNRRRDPKMASPKQIEANRKNAQKSTGPKTAEGKMRVCMNAIKHGLTAATVVLPGEDPQQLQARVDAWKDHLKPSSPLEDYLIERAAHVSWQVDRADRTVAARLTERLTYGPADEAAAETEEVADLARRLFWDPRGPLALYPHSSGLRPTPRISWPTAVDDPINPAQIVNRLEMTAPGCRWLLDRWAELRRRLEAGLKWQAPDRLRAIRLLGAQPMDVMDDERVFMIYLACDAMDPGGQPCLADLRAELAIDEAEHVRERWFGRQPERFRPKDPAAGKAVLLALIEQAVTRLEVLLGVHREREAVSRPGRLDGLAFEDSAEGERLRRYQLGIDRALHRALNQIFKVRKEVREQGADAAEAEVDLPTSAIVPTVGEPDETNPTAAGEPRELGPWEGEAPAEPASRGCAARP